MSTKRGTKLAWVMSLVRVVAAGALVTVVVGWACAAWAPRAWHFSPYEFPFREVVATDPDGDRGLSYQKGGVGWAFMFVWTPSPGGGILGPQANHYMVGWPFQALRSRVEILDRGAARQRQRWQLPWSEIVNRGIATQDLPRWMLAEPERRLAIIPMPVGFAADTVFYGLAYWMMAELCGWAWRRWRQKRERGFPVVMEVPGCK